jgi:hypothetical protein
MHVNWLAAPSRSDYISIKIICLNSAQKIRQFNILFAEFGWEMTKLLWKDFEKLLLSKKLFYFQTSEKIKINYQKLILLLKKIF